jgi:hypothetical protein
MLGPEPESQHISFSGEIDYLFLNFPRGHYDTLYFQQKITERVKFLRNSKMLSDNTMLSVEHVIR